MRKKQTNKKQEQRDPAAVAAAGASRAPDGVSRVKTAEMSLSRHGEKSTPTGRSSSGGGAVQPLAVCSIAARCFVYYITLPLFTTTLFICYWHTNLPECGNRGDTPLSGPHRGETIRPSQVPTDKNVKPLRDGFMKQSSVSAIQRARGSTAQARRPDPASVRG